MIPDQGYYRAYSSTNFNVSCEFWWKMNIPQGWNSSIRLNRIVFDFFKVSCAILRLSFFSFFGFLGTNFSKSQPTHCVQVQPGLLPRQGGVCVREGADVQGVCPQHSPHWDELLRGAEHENPEAEVQLHDDQQTRAGRGQQQERPLHTSRGNSLQIKYTSVLWFKLIF